MKKAAIILLVLVSLVLTRCSSSKEIVTEDTPIDGIAYESHVKPIINNYCVTCHSGGGASAGLDLTNYKTVREYAEHRDLLKRINNNANPMPPSGLIPRYERMAIIKWAQNNYKEKATAETARVIDSNKEPYSFNAPKIIPVDIDKKGFSFFEKMQGHWVGDMVLMGQKIPWFAFDYRAISPSHVHGLFEGGTMGNLFTSFFIAEYKGIKTIMVRNGGILNGIYRTSYFLLDKVEESSGESYYRFVDAYGGQQIMWIEVRFKGNDDIEFNSYTSRFGTYSPPKKHMHFIGQKKHMELAKAAAQKFSFPQNVAEKRFPKGLTVYDWDEKSPATSASYIWTDISKDIVTLGKLAKDPYRIDEMPYVSKLNLKIKRGEKTNGEKLQVYLSKSPLTDGDGKLVMEYGYIKKGLYDEVLLFPEIAKGQDEFMFTYLHPGTYYLTIVVDENEDLTPSKGDVSSKSIRIDVKPSSEQKVVIDDISTVN